MKRIPIAVIKADNVDCGVDNLVLIFSIGLKFDGNPSIVFLGSDLNREYFIFKFKNVVVHIPVLQFWFTQFNSTWYPVRNSRYKILVRNNLGRCVKFQVYSPISS